MRISSNTAIAGALAKRDTAGGSWANLLAERDSVADQPSEEILRAEALRAETYKERLDAIER